MLQTAVQCLSRKGVRITQIRSGSIMAVQSDAGGAQKYDSLQEKAMQENCLLVDDNDKVIGHTTKSDCHRVDSDTGGVKLHRAFSVFLFNTAGEMLVQRRSKHKVN